jgi:hypothetical protein
MFMTPPFFYLNYPIRGLQPRIKEGASNHARRGKNAEAFLIRLPGNL